MRNFLFTGVLLLAFCAAAAAQEWQHEVVRNGMQEARVYGKGKTPDGEVTTIFKIQCASGKGARAVVEFTVMNAYGMKRFPFDDFEGPDAPNQAKKLVTVRVIAPGRVTVVRTAVAGFYSAGYAYAFTFSFVSDRYLRDNVKRLADALAGDASKIEVTVRNPKKPKRLIRAEFPTAGAADAVSKTLEGCGK